jgi:hypothetical protein
LNLRVERATPPENIKRLNRNSRDLKPAKGISHSKTHINSTIARKLPAEGSRSSFDFSFSV